MVFAGKFRSKLQQYCYVLLLHLQSKTGAAWKYLYLQMLQFDSRLSEWKKEMNMTKAFSPFSGKSAKWSWFPFQSFKIWMNFYKLIEISHSACVFILVQYFVYWLVNKVFYFQLFPRNVLPFHSLGISCMLVVYFLLFIMFCLLIMYFSSKLLGHV